MKTNRYTWRAGICASLFVASMAVASEANAAWPEGYYDSLEGKCGVELMKAVKAIAVNHTAISYSDGTWKAFEDTDVRRVNGQDYWWDMYSNAMYLVSAGRPENSVMNTEHSVPNSWWGGARNNAFKDLAHLNPSDSKANSRKSNYPLAELGSVSWTNGVSSIGSPKSGQGGGASSCYEPADEYKGDFARAYMYMFTVYDDIAWESKYSWMYDSSSSTMFKTWAKQLMVKWNAQDPVGEKERVRNDGIYKHQKNRNPFIDLPDLADHIWGAKLNVPFSLDGVQNPDTPDDPQNPDDRQETFEWLSSASSNMGDWTIENITLPNGNNSYVWKWGSYKGNNYLNGSAYISGTPYAAEAYAWSPEVSFEEVETATISFKHAAKFQTGIRNMCKFVVKDIETGSIDEKAIPNWPAAGNWDFASSGDIDLSEYSGRKIRVGYKYKSTDISADTWEINDVVLRLKYKTVGIEMPVPEDEDDSLLVEVWGNNILVPAGARIFDLNGREYDGRNMQRGVYIVVKPSFEKAVKVMVK